MSPVRPLDQGEGIEGHDAEIASHQVRVAFDGVGLSGLEPLTSALSGEVLAVAEPPRTRLGRPGTSTVIRGGSGPLSSRTTSSQPAVTTALTASVNPLSSSSDACSGECVPVVTLGAYVSESPRFVADGGE